MNCISTHGGMGYGHNDRWVGKNIVCGSCGFVIENPPPTGSRWVPRKGFWNTLLNRVDWVPKWPEFIGGIRS